MTRPPMTSCSRRVIAERAFSVSSPQQHCLSAFLALQLVGNGACMCDLNRRLASALSGDGRIMYADILEKHTSRGEGKLS